MNSHLKVLDDLLVKRGDGFYLLTEKGKLASRLLHEFPSSQKPERVRLLKASEAVWAIISNGLFVSILAYFFDQGAVSATWFFFSTVLFVAVCVLVIVFAKIPMPARKSYSPERMKWGYAALGAWLGSVVGFFGGGFAIVGVARILGIARTDVVGIIWLAVDPIVGAIIGATAGYLYFVKRKHKQII